MASSGLAQDGGKGGKRVEGVKGVEGVEGVKLAAPVLVEAFEEGLQEAIETGLQKDFYHDAGPVAEGAFL